MLGEDDDKQIAKDFRDKQARDLARKPLSQNEIDWRHRLVSPFVRFFFSGRRHERPDAIKRRQEKKIILYGKRMLWIIPLLAAAGGGIGAFFVIAPLGLLGLTLLGFTLLPLLGLLGLGVLIGFQAAVILMLAMTRENEGERNMRRILMWFAILLCFVTGPALAIVLELTIFPIFAFAGVGPLGLLALGAVGAGVALLALALTFAITILSFVRSSKSGLRIMPYFANWNNFTAQIRSLVTLGGAEQPRPGPLLSKTKKAIESVVPIKRDPAEEAPAAQPPPLQPLKPLKIVLMGLEGSGKRALLRRYMKASGDEKSDSAREADTQDKLLGIKDAKTGKVKEAKLQILDAPAPTVVEDEWGGWCFKIAEGCLQGADGVMLTYDMGDSGNFDYLNDLINIIREELRFNVPIILVGCKKDLRSTSKVRNVWEFAETNSLGEPIETSAAANENIDEAFAAIVIKAIEKRDKIPVRSVSAIGSTTVETERSATLREPTPSEWLVGQAPLVERASVSEKANPLKAVVLEEHFGKSANSQK